MKDTQHCVNERCVHPKQTTWEKNIASSEVSIIFWLKSPCKGHFSWCPEGLNRYLENILVHRHKHATYDTSGDKDIQMKGKQLKNDSFFLICFTRSASFTAQLVGPTDSKEYSLLSQFEAEQTILYDGTNP